MTTGQTRVRRLAALITIGMCIGLSGRGCGQVPASARSSQPPLLTVRVHGTVTDSASKQPLRNTDVQLLRAGQPVAATTTDPLGRYALAGMEPGAYVLMVVRIGFRPVARSVALVPGDTTVEMVLAPAALMLDSIVVGAVAPPPAVDGHTGDQVFQASTYHGAPATTTAEIVQQALAGAARAPTGEVHIRGQHGEFTYYVDGVPVPQGISGGLSELFAPAVVDRIEFQTGGWDAEYGDRNTAVIKVDTRIPIGSLAVEGSADDGSFGAAGQSLFAGGNAGRLGFVVSATRRVTDMWHDPVMQAPGTGEPLNFHNAGQDLFGFGKLQYVAGPRDFLTFDVNLSHTQFEVPFDSSGGLISDDHQVERGAYASLAWHRALGDRLADGQFFLALYRRSSGLVYTPGAEDTPQFVFYPDTVRYSVSEDRRSSTTGAKADWLFPAMGALQIKTGVDGSIVDGHERFATVDSAGHGGPAVDAPVHGGDLGVYVEGVIQPSPLWEIRPGLRYDLHAAPLAGTATQLSPRLKVSLFPGPQTTLWMYYGRLFVPSPVEDFHVLAAAGQGGQGGLPTYPERDHFIEAGLVHRLVAAGTSLKVDAYHKWSTPAVDDNTLPGTALTATVNVARIRITGIESVVEVRPAGSLGGYLNVALSHAYAHGPITGGFSPSVYPSGWYDLDHDQRLSIVGSVSDEHPRWYASATGIFGSGLTNGNPSAGTTGLGLFDFNAAVKVPPSFIVNISAGTTIRVLGRAVRSQFFVENLFNLNYVLKGAFTSGPSMGRPRAMTVRLDVVT